MQSINSQELDVEEKSRSEEKSKNLLLEPVIIMLLLGMAIFMGLMGALVGSSFGKPIDGFFWGTGFTIGMFIVGAVGTIIWEWFQSRIEEKNLYAYLTAGFAVAVLFSGYTAMSLGQATCIDRDSEPRGGCIEYADDAYEATADQKWEKFWSMLPITAIITMLVAALIHAKTDQKNN